jgi:hypothetical protein
MWWSNWRRGIVYQTQYGGFATRDGSVEGYLDPVHEPEALAELRDLFERTFRGAGAWDYDWTGSPDDPAHRRGMPPNQRLRRLREAVARIPFWVCTSDGEGATRIDRALLENM